LPAILLHFANEGDTILTLTAIILPNGFTVIQRIMQIPVDCMISEPRLWESFEGYRCFNDRFGSCRSMCLKHAKTIKVRPPCR